jgi:acetylornithine deacetylase
VLQSTKDILADLIAFPTVSSDSNLELIAYLAARLEDCGADVHLFTDPSGNKANLFATLGPKKDGGIVLSGHSDVVPVTDQSWTTDPFVMTERDGRLYGRGSCDMKGFIATTIAMAPIFARSVRDRPLHFAFTYDEEGGCIGAAHLAQSLAQLGIRPSVAIIGEPTSMRIIEGHKDCYEYTTRFQGLEGHASAP